MPSEIIGAFHLTFYFSVIAAKKRHRHVVMYVKQYTHVYAYNIQLCYVVHKKTKALLCQKSERKR